MIGTTLVGRLTRDSELRYTAGGKSVLGFTVACDIGFGDKKSTDFVECAMWGSRGESMEPWLKKGTSVTVLGIRARSLETWESNGKSGINELVSVHELALQGSKSASTDKPSDGGGFREKTPQKPAEAFKDSNIDDIPGF